MSRPTICLNMIVRDEAPVLPRCLASVRAYIDSWVVVDTGSVDDTPAVIARELSGLPGMLHHRPWRDFGANRTEAAELAVGHGDYRLIIDADEELVPPPEAIWPPFEADAVNLWVTDTEGGLRWTQPRLHRNERGWRYEGVLHEYLVCDRPTTEETLPAPQVRQRHDGARSLDPRKLAKDIEVLERSLREEPDNARHLFYLANTLRSAGRPRKAIEIYRQRVERGGWAEEVWYSLYQIGRLRLEIEAPWPEVTEAFLAAFRFRSTRAEPLVALARACRERARWAEAWLYAGAAMKLAPTSDILFVENAAYSWAPRDEYAIACHYLGRFEEALEVNDRLLAEGSLPEAERARIEMNRTFSFAAIEARPS